MPETTSIYATGKRKTAVARIWLSPGSGAITVNGKPADEYFERLTSRMVARQSLELLESADRYDVRATVAGGGHSVVGLAHVRILSRELLLLLRQIAPGRNEIRLGRFAFGQQGAIDRRARHFGFVLSRSCRLASPVAKPGGPRLQPRHHAVLRIELGFGIRRAQRRPGCDRSGPRGKRHLRMPPQEL